MPEHKRKRKHQASLEGQLIQATFEHVASKDAFLLFFFLYLYENLCSGAENLIDSDIMIALSFFDDFASWDPNRKNSIKGAIEKFAEHCKDDDGIPLKIESSDYFQYLEVAHILPHSLTSLGSGDIDLSDSKKNTLQILDLFDPGIVHLIDGTKIDSPLNALTLTHGYHQFRTIDPPSARLLGVHHAIAIIMNLSGAGEYIENILRDLEEVDVKADGSTNLGPIMSLRLGGWFNTLTVF
ncbi:hypothetical protein CIHG_03229 [Coccidioides immitis H538.4]|uniref:HNH nuclease domain-containing protein n=3 Tax=Coccidioides immitis TaxID=5501 RepID=A0A0J8QSW4_COCIT|nr:hypothetical protein CIRG_00923 [Coccidioides immitis RMSCC 2394]KMU75561.1 hypothetical protein CISG_04964 [Coccidioides immitis RMSCC 3703]KMU85447.1 hypothetical protein CIHG_03229 [Coccidioides immitis H538.4]